MATSMALSSAANAVNIVAEPIHEHTGSVAELEGHTTYRVYAELDNNDDFLAAVVGGQDFGGFQGLEIVDGDIWVHPDVDFKGPLNADLFNDSNLTYQYTSFITLGKETNEDAGSFYFATDVNSPWAPSGGILSMDSELGSGVFADPINVNDDGNNISFINSPNALPNSELGNNRVMIMQVTTDGLINGQLCLLIYPHGQAVDPSSFDNWQEGFTCVSINVLTSVRNFDQPTIDMNIYPSPANDQVWVKVNDSSLNLANTTLRVFDLSGRAVLTQRLNQLTTSLDVSNLSSGAYVVAIENQQNGEFGRKRFIKQ